MNTLKSFCIYIGKISSFQCPLLQETECDTTSNFNPLPVFQCNLFAFLKTPSTGKLINNYLFLYINRRICLSKMCIGNFVKKKKKTFFRFARKFSHWNKDNCVFGHLNKTHNHVQRIWLVMVRLDRRRSSYAYEYKGILIISLYRISTLLIFLEGYHG